MKVVALAGGVGGAKMVFGLAKMLPAGDLSVIVNTGDDFEHYGLYICPDIDTICYHLGGLNNPISGWGREKDTYNSLNESVRLGGPEWFQIGDKDLGTHLERTRRLSAGHQLSEITMDFCQRWEICSHVFPMTNNRVSTYLLTEDSGELPFQEYFVHQQCQPVVKEIYFKGAEDAKPISSSLMAIQEAELVIICPSNPWVSIDPILSIKDIKTSLKNKKVIAISPIIQGRAIKGPAAKIFSEMGIKPSALSVLKHYREIINGFIYDLQDIEIRDLIMQEGIISYAADTIMKNDKKKIDLAKDVIDFSLTF
jgi:LPPG:FO 2-phospho-L-lactate transferase